MGDGKAREKGPEKRPEKRGQEKARKGARSQLLPEKRCQAREKLPGTNYSHLAEDWVSR
jgi:hypothetical protein